MLQSKSFRNGLGILSLVWVGVALAVGCGGSAGNGDDCEGNDCPEVPGGSCTLNGVTYDDGDSVPSLDGCNSCGCVDGQIACTLVDCANASCNYGGAVPTYAEHKAQAFPIDQKNAAAFAPSYLCSHKCNYFILLFYAYERFLAVFALLFSIFHCC